VFRSACRSVETRRHTAATKRVEVKVDEVLHNAKECVYQITRLVRDEANAVIEHPKAMTLAFDKALGKTHRARARGLRRAPRARGRDPHALQGEHQDDPAQGDPRRGARAAAELGAQNLRRKSGGVYFVPAEYLPTDQATRARSSPPSRSSTGSRARSPSCTATGRTSTRSRSSTTRARARWSPSTSRST
jgi:hypothetical protein